MFRDRFHSRRLFRGLKAILSAIAVAGLSCDSPIGPPSGGSGLPAITLFTIDSNPANVLSAIATIRTAGASWVLVEFGPDSTTTTRTPPIQAKTFGTVVPLLGLHPATGYVARPVAISGDGEEHPGEFLSFTTDSLPADLPLLTVNHSADPGFAYVLLGATIVNQQKGYAVIYDPFGMPAWYRGFDGSVIDVQKQPNGHYTACVVDGPGSAVFYEFNSLGVILRSYAGTDGRETDVHELRLTGDGSVMFSLEYEAVDLTALGGNPAASVKVMVIEYNRNGLLPFIWRSIDHMNITDAAADVSLTGASVNPWHGNAIDIDHDGSLLASFRHTDEIAKIDVGTGTIRWRLGGKQNEFRFLNDPWNGFSHQHGIRRLPNGNILLFDNGNSREPQESRAVEYQLDENGMTATLVWEYRASPPLYSFALGFAQRLATGSTLITYGTVPRIVEADETGSKRWEATPEHLVYRAFAIDSLY